MLLLQESGILPARRWEVILQINHANLGKMLRDMHPEPGEMDAIYMYSIGTDKSGAEWFVVNLTKRQEKRLVKAIPIQTIQERYEGR